MSLSQKIALNTSVVMAGKILSIILGVVSIAILSRYLGQSGFGEYSTILAFLYMVVAAADLGLYSILAREISKNHNESEIVSGIFGLRIISIVFFVVISFLVLLLLPYSSNVKMGIMLASLGFVFMSANQLLMGIFQKHFQGVWPAIGDNITRGLQLALIIVAVKMEAGFLIFPAISAVSIFAGFLFDFILASKIVKISLRFDWKYFSSVLKISWPLATYSVLTLIYFKMDTLLLSLMKPAADVGIYSVAYKVFESLLFFPAVFAGFMLPLMSGAAYDTEKFSRFFKKSFDFLTISALPIVVGGFILSDKIAVLLGGNDFIGASLPIKILMPALFFVFLGNLFGNAIIALNKQKTMIYTAILGVVVSITLNLIFIPKYSYLATSFVTLITEMVVNLAMMIIVVKEIKQWPFDRRILKSIFASSVMGALLFIKIDWNLLLLVLLGAIIYSVIMILIKGISKEEIKIFVLRQKSQI